MSDKTKLSKFQEQVDKAVDQINREKIVDRIWNIDHTVWKDNPEEISNRLGWLGSPNVMKEAASEITQFVDRIRNEGFTNVLLLGMGGSSLAPEVFSKIFGTNSDYPNLSVLDSTDPGAVSAFAERLDPAKTLYITSTKSGSTVETISFMKYFYNQTQKAVGKENAGNHFIAITDPGSGLESMAKELRFRKTFLNDPDIGGRYSALSYFGSVPAALVGMDIIKLLNRAGDMAVNCREDKVANNPGAWLGAVMGALAKSGKDKLTLVTSQQLSPFGAWVEQLIAESTGKEGKGILPVDGEQLLAPEFYGDDRLFVYLRLKNDDSFDKGIAELSAAGHPVVQLELDDLYDIGGQFFRWEMATVVAGSILGINPFNQPNVESAKVKAKEMVNSYKKEGKLPEIDATFQEDGIKVYSQSNAGKISDLLDEFLSQVNFKNDKRSYVALQAYLQPTSGTDGVLHQIRTSIQKKYKLATTVGFGPRFLHSTGQLHKGDAGNGLFIQFTADSPNDLAIPDAPGSDNSSISFGVLKMAQALGDRQALLDAGRRVIRFHLGENVIEGLEKVTQKI